MEKDLYFFVKQDKMKPGTQLHSTGHIGSTESPQKATMQPTPPVHVPHTHSNVTDRPLLHRRQIIIGGPDRQMETQKESSTHSDTRVLDQGSWEVGRVIGVHSRSEPDVESFLTVHQGSTTTTRSVRRPYPPTSWKSISTVDSLGLDQKTSIGIPSAGSDSTWQANERSEGAGLFADRTIAAVGDPKPEKRVTPGELARKGSRRQYTIGSSNPTCQAVVPSSKSGKDKSSHADTTNQVATRGPVLPDPETAYAHAFHYSTCPHTSPPKSRPLNVQPTLVRYYDGLLAHSPADLIERRDNAENDPLDLYILEGSCSDCDLSARRRAESAILDTYTHKLENLAIQLSLLQRDIASEYPQTLPSRDSDAVSAFTLPSTLELTLEAKQSILEIEDQLNELIMKRDREVKQVFEGFTARWGPGTFQIDREDNSQTPLRSCSRSTARTASSTTSFRVPSADTTPEKSLTETSTTSAGANETLPPSRKSSFATRTRASSTQERYSDGTHDVVINSCVDGVKGRGRMLVDWIRPARRGSNPNAGDDMRRNFSRQGEWSESTDV